MEDSLLSRIHRTRIVLTMLGEGGLFPTALHNDLIILSSMNSVLESPVHISSPSPKSRSLIINLRSLAERGYAFSPSLETLESMSDSQLRCLTFQITKSGCGYARWTDFDLLSWSNYGDAMFFCLLVNLKVQRRLGRTNFHHR